MALQDKVVAQKAALEVEAGRGQRLEGQAKATMAEVHALRPLEEQLKQVRRG